MMDRVQDILGPSVFLSVCGLLLSVSVSVSGLQQPTADSDRGHSSRTPPVTGSSPHAGYLPAQKDARVERGRLSAVLPILPLPHVHTSPMSGYVTSGLCDTLMNDSCERDSSYTVVVPPGHVALVSFPRFQFEWSWYSSFKGFVELVAVHGNGTLTRIWKHMSARPIAPQLYNTSLKIRLLIPPRDAVTGGFKMIYSIHPVSLTPPQVRHGVFNCSVSFYPAFQHHFHCNMVTECPRGEDEGSHCPFSSQACGGRIAVSNKCYYHVHTNQTLKWTRARRECQERGGDLVTMKTMEEWQMFFHLLEIKNLYDPVYVGLHSFQPAMPKMYKQSYVWVDGVVNYRYSTRPRFFKIFYDRICFFYDRNVHFRFKYWLNYISCEVTSFTDFICQTEVFNITSNSSVVLPEVGTDAILQKTTLSLTPCLAGHVTHAFLSCDPLSHCDTNDYQAECRTSHDSATASVMKMFVCEDGEMTVPYSLVCDFRQDCDDGSDEASCIHFYSCLDFKCRNGQCVRKSDQCNVARDCWDGSDEVCNYYISHYTVIHRKPPPAAISFHGNGSISQTVIPHCNASCPETHFCCPEGYCVPVYCRCNGVGDCIGKEDEQACQEFTCPGFYRCRSSQVCVHADHLCDGWPQCPLRDDEWLCHTDCPDQCSCQGHAFRCPHTVFLTPYPHLRYLDAGGSGMGVGDVTGLVYLVWLSLARCGVREVLPMNLPNLRTLHLSRNRLTALNMDVFVSLGNMRVLDLSHNPLELVVSRTQHAQFSSLVSVNFSGILWTSFNSTVLANYPRVRELDLSHSALTGISREGFGSLLNLVHIDLRGCTIRTYPSDVFHSLSHLQTIRADEFKLCCQELLPPAFDRSQCFAPGDEISSCDDLLRSDTYRAFLWLLSVLSVIGNIGCLVIRLILLKRKSHTAFGMFVTNLSAADLLMGVYLAMVGAADHVYRGQYVWFERTWKPSVPCKLAGFLSMLSSETSAFIICLITLDRFLVLSSPFSELRFRRRTAAVVCLLVWTLGLLLAAVPLLPATADWEFYSQTGICIPLPITRRSFKGRNYAFGVIIIFNLVLFLLIATGQAMIYWTIRTTSMAQSSTKKTEDLTIARRLLSVVLSDFLCWFPIGFLGVLAASGTPVPGEVNVGMAIFVLPLNAALNPFLYTFNALVDRWRKREEQQLLKELEARAVSLGTSEAAGL